MKVTLSALLPHNAWHMCCGRGGGASAAAQQASSTGRARAAATPAADSSPCACYAAPLVSRSYELARGRKLMLKAPNLILPEILVERYRR